MSDLILIAGGIVLLAIAFSVIPSGDRAKGHFLDGVENPHVRRIAGLGVAVLSAACGVLGLVLFGAALVE